MLSAQRFAHDLFLAAASANARESACALMCIVGFAAPELVVSMQLIFCPGLVLY